MNTKLIGSFYLPFDRAAYNPGQVPCQALAMSYFSTGLAYCVQVTPSIMLPVQKVAVKQCMEAGCYVWVANPTPLYIVSSQGQFLLLRFSRSANEFSPLFASQEDFVEFYKNEPYYNSFRRASCRAYSYSESRGVGNNIPMRIERIERDSNGQQ